MFIGDIKNTIYEWQIDIQKEMDKAEKQKDDETLEFLSCIAEDLDTLEYTILEYQGYLKRTTTSS